MDKKTLNTNPESLKQRLNNIAKKQNRDFNLILIQYFHERFLYRLSVSKFKQHFVLKGALLLLSKNIERSRPTKDIDFLAIGILNDKESIDKIIKTICSIKYDDGVTFDSEQIDISIIKEGAEYEGIRATFNAYLGRIERKISIDIGFGDIFVNKLKEIQYPTMLTDEELLIYGYSLETVIAEKLQAIVFLSYQNSRMKDFYDLYYVFTNYKMSKSILSKSIYATFKARKTETENIKNIFSLEYKQDKNMNLKWQSYINKNRLECVFNFEQLMDKIELNLKKYIEINI